MVVVHQNYPPWQQIYTPLAFAVGEYICCPWWLFWYTTLMRGVYILKISNILVVDRDNQYCIVQCSCCFMYLICFTESITLTLTQMEVSCNKRRIPGLHCDLQILWRCNQSLCGQESSSPYEQRQKTCCYWPSSKQADEIWLLQGGSLVHRYYNGHTLSLAQSKLNLIFLAVHLAEADTVLHVL